MPAGKPPEPDKPVEADRPKTELQLIVEEMRQLGVTEYSKGGVRVVLGGPVAHPTEKTEADQQRIRDEREKARLERENRIRFGASSRIIPSPKAIR